MKCLVTGGAGFIGSNIVISLLEQGYEVDIIDNFSSGDVQNIKRFEGNIFDIDISNDRLMSRMNQKYDLIYHQAAITDPRNPNNKEILHQNINGFKLILEKALKHDSKLIYASTASLYGNGSAPQREEQAKEILSTYAQSKLIIDEMASHYYNKMHIVGLRYFNVFGPNESHKGRAASMIYQLSKRMKEGMIPKIFKMGQHKRDHIYVKDCVKANIKAISAVSGIYNVGTGKATSFNELIQILNAVLKTNHKAEFINMPYDKSTYQNHTQADTTKAESVLGFKAQYSLVQGIQEYIGINT